MAVQEPMESPKVPEFQSITKEFLLGANNNDILTPSNDFSFQSLLPQFSSSANTSSSKLLSSLDDSNSLNQSNLGGSSLDPFPRSSFLSGSLCHLYNGARNKAPFDYSILGNNSDNLESRQSPTLPPNRSLTLPNCDENDQIKPSVAPNASRAPTTDQSGTRKRKRPTSKREPLASEYSDDQEYQQAWLKWREDRDNNNVSVKQSRQRAKLKKLGALKAASESKSAGSDEDEEMHSLKQDLRLLVMKCKGRKLNSVQSKRAALLLQLYDDKETIKSTSTSRVRKWKASMEKKTRKSASPPATATPVSKTTTTRTGRLSKSRTR